MESDTESDIMVRRLQCAPSSCRLFEVVLKDPV